MKPCIPGAAYICEGWTEEKEWFNRKFVKFCYKCGRRIELNNKTHRYRHLTKQETK